jgi:hypothetical protein
MSTTGVAVENERVDLVIAIPGLDRSAAELDSLARTLRADGALRSVDIDARTTLAEGAMGPVTDVLLVSFGSGGVGVAVLQTVLVWLRSRRPDVRVKVKRADGSEAEVALTQASDPARVIELLRAAEGAP